MTVKQGVRLICAYVSIVAPVSQAAAQGAYSASEERNTEMSVEISITHTMLDAEGNPALPPSAPAMFKVTRTRQSSGWLTVVTYGKHAGRATRASAHPLDGARVEFDEGANTARVYDADGKLNTQLSRDFSDGMPAARGAGQWLEGLVATDEDRFVRARDLSEKYGRPQGRAAGLDRFLWHRDGVVEEVLADPRSALPREINTVRDGVLESHIVFDYDRRTDGTWLRRSIRTEQIVPGAPNQRTRTTVEFTNLSTGGR